MDRVVWNKIYLSNEIKTEPPSFYVQHSESTFKTNVREAVKSLSEFTLNYGGRKL